MELEGALAVVTGAGHGIGRATALALANAGARVMVADIDGKAAEKVAAEVMEGGGEAHSFAVDVADRAAIAALATTICDEHGPVDVLVNNAGVGMSARFTDMTAADWDWIRSINLDGVVNGCATFGPGMLERGRGHVVNLASGLAYTPRATEPAYVATKAAVLALSRSLRADWRTRGVGVSAICPGVIDTGIITRTRFLGARAGSRTQIERLFRRGHSPDRVADAVLDAIRRDRAVVPVGWEARLGWWFSRFGPVAGQQFLAGRETV